MNCRAHVITNHSNEIESSIHRLNLLKAVSFEFRLTLWYQASQYSIPSSWYLTRSSVTNHESRRLGQGSWDDSWWDEAEQEALIELLDASTGLWYIFGTRQEPINFWKPAYIRRALFWVAHRFQVAYILSDDIRDGLKATLIWRPGLSGHSHRSMSLWLVLAWIYIRVPDFCWETYAVSIIYSPPHCPRISQN